MHAVLTMLERGRPGIDRGGAHFPDLGGARPPDEPAPAAKPRSMWCGEGTFPNI